MQHMALDTESMDAPADEFASTEARVEDGEQDAVHQEEQRGTTTTARTKRLGLIAGLLVVFTLSALVGWLGFRYSQLHHEQQDRALFLGVGRQAALNLTAINYTHVDADVQRILDSSSGPFYDEFRARSQLFIQVVKQVQSTTEGSITEAGLESMHGDTAEVLVAVSVKTTNAGVAEQEPRAWRMRIEVHKVGDGGKVFNVQFVP